MSKERSKRTPNRQIIDEAATWFVEINEGEPDRETRERFDEWLRRSPEHAQAYLRMLPVWEEGAQLDAQTNGDPRALIARAREASNVVPFEVERIETTLAPASSKARRPWALAASVAALCISLALTAWWLVERRHIYETGTGEQRLISLSDGSRIELNSRSKLRVRFDEQARDVELLAGQALFRVAKDPTRPFIVDTGETSVRAVGTQFDVYKKRTGTIVTVVEGRVAVDPAADLPSPASSSSPPLLGGKGAGGEVALALAGEVLLSAGEQLSIRAGEPPIVREKANILAVTAWTEQRLEFSNTPLVEVAEEFNRYNERQLIVPSGALHDFHVTGTFSSSDPTSLVTFLKAQEGVKVEESKHEIIVTEQ